MDMPPMQNFLNDLFFRDFGERRFFDKDADGFGGQRKYDQQSEPRFGSEKSGGGNQEQQREKHRQNYERPKKTEEDHGKKASGFGGGHKNQYNNDDIYDL